MPGQLAALWRKKYPGDYDDLDDNTLESLITKKFPGDYDDLVEPDFGEVQVTKPKGIPISTQSPFLTGTNYNDFRTRSVVENPSYPRQKVLPKPTGVIQPYEEPSWFKKAFTPPQAVRDFASSIGNYITDPNTGINLPGAGSLSGSGPLYHEVNPEMENAQAKGFLAGALQGGAEQLNPGNIALLAAGGGEVAALRNFARLRDIGKLDEAANVLKIAEALETVTKAASIPVGYEGLLNTAQGIHEGDWQKALSGIPQMAGAALGMRSRVPQIVENIKGRPQSVSTPQTGDINLTQDATGAFGPRGMPEGVIPYPEESAIIAPFVPEKPVVTPPVDILANQQLDPRITGLAPQPAERVPALDQFGNTIAEYAGPQMAGELGTPPPPMDMSQEIAKIEAARAAAKNQVDQELQLGEEPSAMARTEGGGTRMDIGDRKEMIEIFKNTYSGEVPQVAIKELLQNAIDAVATQPGGQVNVNADPKTGKIIVTDNGKGLTRNELDTIYTNLSSSGKRGGEQKTVGELGVGKTTYLVAGEHVKITTTARDPETGRLKQIVLQGTPEQIMEEVHPVETIMPEGTKTGTTVEFQAPKDSKFSGMLRYLGNFKKYSSTPVPINMTSPKYDWEHTPTTSQMPIKQYSGKYIGEGDQIGTAKGTTFKVSIPDDAQHLPETSQINLILVNRGMMQGVDAMSVPPGLLPDRLIVELDPTVKGTHTDYPLTAPTREQLKWETKHQVMEFVRKHLVEKATADRNAELGRIYAAMEKSIGGNHVIYETEGKYTPQELSSLVNSPTLVNIGREFGHLLDELQIAEPLDSDIKLDKFGYIIDPKVRGVNIRDPRNRSNYAVMINPLAFFEAYPTDPQAAAQGIIHTIIHEYTHMFIREEDGNFTAKLGDIHERFPLERQIHARNKVLQSIGGKPGYSPEIQKILQRHTEFRGRKPTKTDVLIREGSGQRLTQEGQESASFSRATSGGGAVNRIALRNTDKATLKAAITAGYEATGRSTPEGYPIWVKRQEGPRFLHPTDKGYTQELYNTPRGAMSVDLPFMSSAAFRQGATGIAINPRGWAKAWVDSARAYGAEHTFQKIMSDISSNPLFREERGPRNTKLPSIAERSGIKLTDLGSLSNREENIKAAWAEKIPLYGRHVRASNRAYTAFLNSLRASTFDRMYEQRQLDTRSLIGRKIPGVDLESEQNLPLLKNIGEAIMTLTGRGPARIDAPTIGGRTHSLDLTRAMGFLSNVFFSPRLNTSRIALFNPSTYANADPFVRKMYVKGFLGAIATWWGIASLGEMLGAEVNKDPNNADFGKIRVGNTRIDPGAGFQQWLVLASRLRPESLRVPFDIPSPPYGEMISDPGGGKWTSSSSGRTYNLGEGYKPETGGSLALDFTQNKLHPTLALGAALATASQDRPVHLGDRTLQLFLPIFTADVAKVIQDDPNLIPLITGTSTIGFGGNTYERGENKPSITPLLGLDQLDMTIGGR